SRWPRSRRRPGRSRASPAAPPPTGSRSRLACSSSFVPSPTEPSVGRSSDRVGYEGDRRDGSAPASRKLTPIQEPPSAVDPPTPAPAPAHGEPPARTRENDDEDPDQSSDGHGGPRHDGADVGRSAGSGRRPHR